MHGDNALVAPATNGFSIATVTGIARETVRRKLQKLIDRNLILRMGRRATC